MAASARAAQGEATEKEAGALRIEGNRSDVICKIRRAAIDSAGNLEGSRIRGLERGR
jgi:hypothetical protein